MSGLRPRGKGKCRVEGHGHHHVKTKHCKLRQGCSIYNNSFIDKNEEKRQWQKEVINESL